MTKMFNLPKPARMAAVNAAIAYVAMFYALSVIYTFFQPERVFALVSTHPFAGAGFVAFLMFFPFTAVVANDLASKE